MLDLKFIRENPERVRANLVARGSSVDLDRLLALDAQRRSLLQELEDVRRQRNEHSAAIKGRKPSDEERERGRLLKESEPRLETELRAAEAELDTLNRAVPNMTQPDVPPGRDESANQLVRRWGEPPKFDFEPLDHLALAEKHDLVDFEGGAKVTGPKFYFLKNEAVLLEHALVRYALELLRGRGFTLMQTPDLARRDVCAGTGYNPEGPERQIYTVEDSELALIGTSEITLSGLHAGDLLEPERLPIRYGGLSHCFRVEAGGAGRVGRGLYRVHQFTKVEMFAYTHPDASEDMHREFLAIEEQVFQGLELPYRVMLLCAGDAAGQSARTYDIEAWMPGRSEGGSYGEVTSSSTCTDYQARRLGIRFRDPDGGKPRFVHMLNGTAVATARLLIPLLEIHQQADGSIRIPKALQPYTGFDRIG